MRPLDALYACLRLGDNGRKALAELDAVDLEAIRLVSAWGVSTNGHTERVRPLQPLTLGTGKAGEIVVNGYTANELRCPLLGPLGLRMTWHHRAAVRAGQVASKERRVRRVYGRLYTRQPEADAHYL